MKIIKIIFPKNSESMFIDNEVIISDNVRFDVVFNGTLEHCQTELDRLSVERAADLAEAEKLGNIIQLVSYGIFF